ncbi:MAG: CapA family protein [Lachnospiraceae bacterium]|nr:CapA family protein [Lachnospiraceae bacterium]
MKLLFFGDFSYDFDFVAEDILSIGEFAREKDAKVILNLEGPITDGSGREIRKRGKHLPQRGKCGEALAALGVSGVTLANNHMMDYCVKGLNDTLNELDKLNIKHSGAGISLGEALEPMVFCEGEESIAVFSFGWDIEETVYAGLHKSGCAPRKETVILDTLREYSVKHPGRKIIAALHWGFEYNPYPLPRDTELARKLCETDLVCAVIGHHSHCPQPFEIINGKPVFYSLGNFYYSSRRHKYSARRFDYDPSNLCDYCIAALLDTAHLSAEPLVFYYDIEKDRTEFREDLAIPVSMPEMDPGSEEYRHFALSKALHKNPIPGPGRIESDLAFLKFNLKRNLARYL